MEIEQLQADVDQIFSQYPWATEETAQKMAALATTNAVKTTALALAMKQLLGTTSADGLKSSIKQTASDLKKILLLQKHVYLVLKDMQKE